MEDLSLGDYLHSLRLNSVIIKSSRSEPLRAQVCPGRSSELHDSALRQALESSIVANRLVLDRLHVDGARQASLLQQLNSHQAFLLRHQLNAHTSTNSTTALFPGYNYYNNALSGMGEKYHLVAGPEPSLYRLGINRESGYTVRPRPVQRPTQIIPGCTLNLSESGLSSSVASGNAASGGSTGPLISDIQITGTQPPVATDNLYYSPPSRASQLQQGPRVAEVSVYNSKPQTLPAVVTPTDSPTDPTIPAALATNNSCFTGYGYRHNFPAGIDSNNADFPTYTYGKIRRYNRSTGRYGEWEPLLAHDPARTRADGLYMDQPCEIQLKRGGTIRYFPRIVSEDRREYLAQKCRDFQEYRQYKFGPGGLANEPRVHVLLSASASMMSSDNASHVSPGYQYHGIRMQAKPISTEPVFAALSAELAAIYQFPNQEWNIGCDAIVYRNGNDNIGWHSDDTQGESKVTCIVPECPGGTSRPVHVRPKKNAKTPLQDGDEEVQLFVRQGDGYEMDGVMQDGYEHCLPKVKKVQGLRSALIFRQGRVASVHDSGNRVVDIAAGRPILAPPPALPTIIGHPPDSANIIEGNDSYSRADLFLTRVHRCDRRGVCGNIASGAESIVVSRQDSGLREEDGLQWIKYTSSRRQGGGGFATSFKKKQPIRVFRSSSLNNKFAPPPRPQGNTSYRYDGLYRVRFMWDEKGNRVEEGPDPNGAQYTFLLWRLPKVEAAGKESAVGNKLSTNELWRIICERNNEKVQQFVPSQPTTHLDELALLPPTNRFRQDAGEKSKEKGATSSRESMPSQAVAKSIPKSANDNDNDNERKIEINWAQCERCEKWRILRNGFDVGLSDISWFCEMNTSDPLRSTCDDPEEDEDDYIQSLEDEFEEEEYHDDDYVPPPFLATPNDIGGGNTQPIHNKTSDIPKRKKTKRLASRKDRSESKRMGSRNGTVRINLVVKIGQRGRPFQSTAKLPVKIFQQIRGDNITQQLEPNGRKKRKRSKGSPPRKSPKTFDRS